MRLSKLVLAAAVFSLAPPAATQSPSPIQEQQQIAQAVERGRLLYAYDQAAWHGTDDFRKRSPDLMSKTCGRVVTGSADAADLAFVDCSHKFALYRARFVDGRLSSGVIVEGTDRAPLSQLEQQLLVSGNRGLEAFRKAKSATCSKQQPNFVVLPPTGPGQPALVYLLSPQPGTDILPLGGHHRVEVRPDGSTGTVRPFTKACLTLSTKPPSGSKAVALWTLHLLDLTPTEIHVFTSLAGKVPLFVGTRDKAIWRVDGRTIQRVNPSQSNGN